MLNVAAYRWLWSYHDEVCQTRHRFAANELRRLAEGRALPCNASRIGMP